MGKESAKKEEDVNSRVSGNGSCFLKSMIALNHSNGQSFSPEVKPGNAAFGQIVITKGNPSRGKGYEISHFIRRNGTIRSLSDLDIFLPSMRKAAAWVHRYYPDAKLITRRKDHFGRLAGLSFECSLAELVPGSRLVKRGVKKERSLQDQSPAQ